MTSAREIMTAGAECVGADESVVLAAKRMAQLGVGALPIRGSDDGLKGILTDRDIVIKVLARERDPATTKAAELAQGEVLTVNVDDDTHQILHAMSTHKVRRLPVLDGGDLVGMVALADVARDLPDLPQVRDLLEALSTD